MEIQGGKQSRRGEGYAVSTLTIRKPMKRTGFKRKQPVSIYKTAALGPSMTLIEKREAEREKRLADIAKSAIANALEKPANVALVSLSAPTAPVEKENPLRSEAYRRAVASTRTRTMEKARA